MSKPTIAQIELILDTPFLSELSSIIIETGQPVISEVAKELLSYWDINENLLSSGDKEHLKNLISTKFVVLTLADPRLKTILDSLWNTLKPLYDHKTAALFNHAAQFGYIITPNMSIELLKISEQANTNDEYVKLLTEYFEQDQNANITSMFANWKTLPYFQDRSQILDQVITAHTQDLHALTIPTLLPFVDGLFRQNLRVHFKRYVNDNQPALKIKRPPELGSLSVDDVLSNIKINSFYNAQEKDSSLPISQQLSRHDIAHGMDSYYPSKENFYRAILMIDFFVFLLENNLLPPNK